MNRKRFICAVLTGFFVFVLTFSGITVAFAAGGQTDFSASDDLVNVEAKLSKAAYSAGESISLSVSVKSDACAMGEILISTNLPDGFTYADGSDGQSKNISVPAGTEVTDNVKFESESKATVSDSETTTKAEETSDKTDVTTKGDESSADTASDTRDETSPQTSDTSAKFIIVLASLFVAVIAGVCVYFARTKAFTMMLAVVIAVPVLVGSIGMTGVNAAVANESTSNTVSLKCPFTYDGTLYELTVDASYKTLAYAEPTGYSTYTEKDYPLVTDADIYIAPDGSDDDGDGSFDNPFATLEKARDTIREMKAQADREIDGEIVVAMKAGTYKSTGFRLTEQDSGSAEVPIKYCAYGDGEVIISGAVNISTDDAEELNEQDKALFRAENTDNIIKIDLTKYDIDVQNLTHLNELFDSKGRCRSARYPNVNADGSDNLLYNKGWFSGNGNQYSSKEMTLSKSFAKYVEEYHTLEGARICGYLQYDWWCDDSEIVSYDPQTRIMTVNHTNYGVGSAPYFYLYNISEELDDPGEYYIDKNTGTLYLYKTEETSYKLSVFSPYFLSGSKISYITFSNIIFENGSEDGIYLSGNNLTFERCTMRNFLDRAIIIEGDNNLVTDCVFYNIGGEVIRMTGGDRTTLTKANSKVDNNLIYDFGQVYKTYSSAINVTGVGLTASHNEIYNAPHQAIGYGGNYVTIEYNLIHDVVKQSSDAGAIYSGRDWTQQGNVVRYNILYNIGNETFTGNGIYFDDGLSGQTAYGNILYNIAGNAFLIGGGRDINVKNNVIIGSRIEYDARFRDAFQRYVENGTVATFTMAVINLDGVMWKNMAKMPITSDVWKEAFPTLANVSYDFDDYTNKDFPINPAYSVVKDNVTVSGTTDHKFNKRVTEYSTVEGNDILPYTVNPCFADPNNGDYTITDPNFPSIPINQIGRY